MEDYNRLAEDLANYLEAKLPDVDIAVKMEAAEYISNRVFRFLQDALFERDRDWRQSLKSQQRNFNNELDRLRRRYRGESNG